jgi:tetratricopeptide (TPR) repeat protein
LLGTVSRTSLVWLAVLELLALTTTAALYIAGVIADAYLWPALGAAALGAGLVFLMAMTAAPLFFRPPEPRRVRQPAAKPPADPEQAEEYMRLGRRLLREQRSDEAAKLFQQVLAGNARNWQAYNYLGRAYVGMGLYDEAKEAYERAIGLEYNYASAHFNLAAAHEKIGEYDRALECWRRYLEVGQTIGERPDMLEHARSRLVAVERRLRKGDGDDDWRENDEPFDHEDPQ